MHWARDAAEANAIVAGIAKGHGAREVIKVKSIATDEIELNKALAAEGIEAIETDLAELIIQLAGERSSAHPRPGHPQEPRRDPAPVRAHDRQGRGPRVGGEGHRRGRAPPPAREVPVRARWRSRGANFGIAETGTVAVVESEGNGRMCTTLPEVLVTVMGIEKLLPEWRDLEVFLQLLPRSSTAERMNPYTSLWTGVREGDGPKEFHIVLLDNHRTRLLADAEQRGRVALHPLRRVPERVPDLQEHRRARVRDDGLDGADRERSSRRTFAGCPVGT